MVLDYTSLSGDQPGYIEDEEAIDRADAVFELEDPLAQNDLPESEVIAVNDDEEEKPLEEGANDIVDNSDKTVSDPGPSQPITAKPKHGFRLLTDEELDELTDEELTEYLMQIALENSQFHVNETAPAISDQGFETLVKNYQAVLHLIERLSKRYPMDVLKQLIYLLISIDTHGIF